MKANVFLGGGRITSALVAGLMLAKYKHPILVHDRNSKKLQELERQHGVMVERDLHRAVEAAELLIIAVRPDSVRELLNEIGEIHRPLTVVSLAAGVLLAKLQTGFERLARWARAMPSPASRSGRGLTAVTFSRGLSVGTRNQVRNLFSQVGPVLEIPESQFDAFTVTYSSSHGYHALAALIRAAEAMGLNTASARVAATHAFADGILGLARREIISRSFTA